jgi:hypothetical protein
LWWIYRNITILKIATPPAMCSNQPPRVVESLLIGGLADIQLSSPRTQNEPIPTHALLGYGRTAVRGTIYRIYANIIGHPFSCFDFSVRGPKLGGHVSTSWSVPIHVARAHVARFTRTILLNLAPAWQACPWKHRPSSSAQCVVTIGPSRVGQHKGRALFGTTSVTWRFLQPLLKRFSAENGQNRPPKSTG